MNDAPIVVEADPDSPDLPALQARYTTWLGEIAAWEHAKNELMAALPGVYGEGLISLSHHRFHQTIAGPRDPYPGVPIRAQHAAETDPPAGWVRLKKNRHGDHAWLQPARGALGDGARTLMGLVGRPPDRLPFALGLRDQFVGAHHREYVWNGRVPSIPNLTTLTLPAEVTAWQFTINGRAAEFLPDPPAGMRRLRAVYVPEEPRG